MKPELQSEDREMILGLYGQAHTIRLRLEDLSDQLDIDSVAQTQVQSTAFKAHDLLASLSEFLID